MFVVRSFSHPFCSQFVLIKGAAAPGAVRARGTAMGGKQAGSPKKGWMDKPFGVMRVQGTLQKWTRPNLPNPNTCREMSGTVFWSWVVLYKMEGYTKICQLKRWVCKRSSDQKCWKLHDIAHRSPNLSSRWGSFREDMLKHRSFRWALGHLSVREG